MTRTTYNSASPYFDTSQTSWYLRPIQLRTIPSDVSDLRLIVSPKHALRPDLLSDELYNTPAYWWVFMIRNMNTIRDPIYDFTAGVAIYAPTADRLHKLLG